MDDVEMCGDGVNMCGDECAHSKIFYTRLAQDLVQYV